MLLREFNEQFGIGLIQLCVDKIMGVSKSDNALSFYALDIDTSSIPNNSEVLDWMDIIITDTELHAVDSVSTQNTEVLSAVSLDTKVLGLEEEEYV